MADNSLVVTDLTIELAKFETAMQSADRLTGKLDADIKATIKDLNTLEEQMNKLQTGGLNLVIKVDSGDLDSVQSDVNALDGQNIDVQIQTDLQSLAEATGIIDVLDSSTPSVTITADDGELVTADETVQRIDDTDPKVKVDVDDQQITGAADEVQAIDDDDPFVNVDVDSSETETAKKKVGEIDDSDPNVTVKVDDSEVSTAKSDVQEIDDTDPLVKVDTDASELQEIKDQLRDIKRLAVVDLVFSVPEKLGKAKELVGKVPVVGDLLGTNQDMNAAQRQFEASLTSMGFALGDFQSDSVDVGKTFDNVVARGLADTRTEVAGVAAQFVQLGLDAQGVDDATTSAFEAAKAAGLDVNEVIRQQRVLVSNGLAKDYPDAANLIVAANQTAAGSFGDFSGTVDEFSGVFNKIGLNGKGALDLLNAGLEAGARNGSVVADVFKEVGFKVQEALSTNSGGTYDALQALGLTDEAEAFNQGKLTGTQFADAVLSGIKEKGYSGAKADQLITDIFGSPIENLGVDVFKNIDFGSIQPDGLVSPTLAKDTADTITDTFGNAWSELETTLASGLTTSIKIGGVSIDEFLDKVKDKVKELAELLQNGTALPEALEIALEAPGLADEIHRFEGSIGNFLIEFQLGLASVLDFLGKGEAAQNVRTNVAQQSVGQFQFDLEFAKSEKEIQEITKRAIDRGASQADLSQALGDTTLQLIDKGDIDKAQMLLDTLDTPQVFADLTTGLGIGSQHVTTPITKGVDLNATPEEIQKQIEAASSAKGLVVTAKVTKIDIDTSAAKQALDEAKANFDDIAKNQATLSAPIQVGVEPQGYVRIGRDYSGTLDNTGVQTPYVSGASAPTNWSDSGSAILPPVVAPGATDQVQQYNAYVTSASVDITGATEAITTATDNMSGDVVSNFDAVKDAALQNFGTDIPDSLDTTTEQLEIAVVGTDDLAVNGGARIVAFGQVATTIAGQVTSAWQSVQGALAGAAGALPTEPVTTTGDPNSVGVGNVKVGTPTMGTPGHATGGPATGWSRVGEDGEELVNFGQSGGSVLNNQTTSKIVDAMQAVISGTGGMSSSQTTTNNFNINVTNNNQGMAARAGSDTRLATAVRGF